MSAWLQLVRKELRLGRSFAIGIFIFMAILSVISVGYTLYNPMGIVSMLVMMMSPLFVFYLLVYLIVSLSNEKHSFSIWMQTPLPGWSLFAAKLISGLIYMLLTGVVALLLTLLVFQLDGGVSFVQFAPDYKPTDELLSGQMVMQFMQEHYVQLVISSLPIVLGASMLLAAGYLVFFISNKVLQRWLGRWSILAGVIIVILVLNLYDRLDAWGIKQLFSWGQIPLLIPGQFVADDEGVRIGMTHMHSDSLSFGHFVFDFLVLGIVVLLSGWLLDRKAEVR